MQVTFVITCCTVLILYSFYMQSLEKVAMKTMRTVAVVRGWYVGIMLVVAMGYAVMLPVLPRPVQLLTVQVE